jgi:transposase InsO family protein
MRALQLTGVRRGKRVVTTRADVRAARPADLVQRWFQPAAPNRLWVADFTYVPVPAPTMSAKAPTGPTDPWRQIVADLRGAVLCGALKSGDQLPSVTQLANRYKVAASAAHRAVAELAASGLVTVSRGKRAIVTGQ